MKRKSLGFNSMEMVAVAGVMGVAMAVATPSLVKTNQSYKLSSAASQLSQSLQNTRFEAIRRNTTNTIAIDKKNNTIMMLSTTKNSSGQNQVKTSVIPLPSGVVIASLPSTISAPSIVQSAYSNKDTFSDSDYKNLSSNKAATSFTKESSSGSNSGSGSSGSGRNDDDDSQIYQATFTSKGLPATKSGSMADPGIVHWVYMKNVNDDYMAITITSAGSTQVWRYKNNSWITTTQ